MLLWESAQTDAGALDRLARAGRGGVERFMREDGAAALVLCDDGEAPPGTVEKRVATLFCGGRSGARAGAWLFCVGLWTPEAWGAEFCAWYRHEHAPILLECPVWSGFRFVEQHPAPDGRRGRQFYAMHWLAERAALDSDFRLRSRSTPWFLRLSKNDWFDGAFVRRLYRRWGD